MRSNKGLIAVIMLLLVTLGLLGFYAVNRSTSSVGKVTVLEGNEEEVRKMYVETNSGNIQNKYTAENPLIVTINESFMFHMAFAEDEYLEQKQIAVSTVYTTDEGTIPSNILTRTSNDEFFDQFYGIRFGFRGTTAGDCRIVIKNKNDDNDIYETLYVRVVPANTIRYKDTLLNRNVDNPGNITVDTETEVELSAVLLGDLAMEGDKPSEANYVGSGFWSWTLPITNEWQRLENNKWKVTFKFTTMGEGDVTVGLGRNGDGGVGSVDIHVRQNKIEVDNVKIGTYEYNHINKNVATRMINGFNKGDNNPYNRYVINIGEDIKLNASVSEGYKFEVTNTNSLKVKTESSFSNGNVSASFTGINPGDNEIVLKNADGVVTETFFVTVHYPFYVNTGIGEIHKDYIHEYVGVALRDFYYSHNDAVIADPNGAPQYVKNGRDYYMFYYVFNGNKVNVVGYTNAEDTIDFDYEGNIEMTNHKIEVVTEGPKAGFRRISADFAVTVRESGGLVRLGNDTFVIAERNNEDNVHHFDLETADGGTLTKVERVNYIDGYTTITTTEYTTRISDIHGSKVYNEAGEVIAELPKSDYWLTFPEGSTQFESTSAYVTNSEGHLIDARNNVIDDAFRGGLVDPQVTVRNIPLKNVDKVDFDVDVLLNPVSRKVELYKRTEDGELEYIETTNEQVSQTETELMQDYILTMDKLHILDAFNKCPFHNGLDFTVRLQLHTERDSDEDINGVTDSNKQENPNTKNGIKLLFVVGVLLMVSSATSFILTKKKKFYA